MKFDFFTFGGFLFWEDVFFYQKWRIQRHCITKKYRLLDSWDIRRESGNFEDCQKAFIDCINCYEITKQPKHMVILLHGYMDSKNIFKNLWRKFVLTKSSVAALNYPSTFRNSLAVAHQLLFFLNHTEDVEEARRLITVQFMNKIKNLKLAFQVKDVRFAFYENNLFIALSTDKDLFSIGSFFSKAEDKTQFFQMFEEIISIIKLIDYFKLNN